MAPVVSGMVEIPSTTVFVDAGSGRYEVDIPHLYIAVRKAGTIIPPNPWAYPVGSEEYPTVKWYSSQHHTWDPKTNPGGHTGEDLNVEVLPRGDIDRGQPAWAVADGVVSSVGYSAGWLGVVVVEHVEDDGTSVWFRYAHLDRDSVEVQVGERVVAAQLLGVLGDYTGGDTGDHLHLDAAWQAFEWNVYRDASISWIDPVPVLRRHLDDQVVDAMLAKG